MINNFKSTETNKNNNQSFVFYESVFKQVEIIEKRIGKETAYNFLYDVISYGLYGVLPDEKNDSWLYGFEQVMASINGAKNRYAAAVENGKKGGRPKLTLNQDEVLQKKEELKTWKAVAEYYNISEQALKNYRTQWEQENPTENTELIKTEQKKEEIKTPPPLKFKF